MTYLHGGGGNAERFHRTTINTRAGAAVTVTVRVPKGEKERKERKKERKERKKKGGWVLVNMTHTLYTHAQAASLSLSLSSLPYVPCKAGAQAVHSVALAPVGTLNVLFRSFNGFPDQKGSTAAQ